jgi:hypothetical protein
VSAREGASRGVGTTSDVLLEPVSGLARGPRPRMFQAYPSSERVAQFRVRRNQGSSGRRGVGPRPCGTGSVLIGAAKSQATSQHSGQQVAPHPSDGSRAGAGQHCRERPI